MKQLIEHIVKSIVDKPDEVNVLEIDGEETTVLEVRVHADDTKYVIGNHGRMATAMRTILLAVGSRASRRVHLEIME